MIIPYIYIKYLVYIIFFLVIPVFALILLKIFQKWTMGKCNSLVCLAGKTAIVTGGASGIGFETALHLAARGCRVIIADVDGGLRAKNKIIQATNNTNISVKYLNLASLGSVREFAKEINDTEERLDILINNAGVATMGNKHTEDGLHETMQINHFGPFLLTHLLVDLLKKSAPSRIIFVSSALAFFSNLSIENLNYPKDHPLSLFRTALIYGNSKLCNVISANGFAQRLESFGITSNSLHPGWVNTNIWKNVSDWTGLDRLERIILNPISYLYGKNPTEGAQTTLHLALSNSVKEVTGKHFWDCLTFPLPPGARSDKFCRDIWEESEIFVKLSEKEKIPKMSLKENIELLEGKVIDKEDNNGEVVANEQQLTELEAVYDINWSKNDILQDKSQNVIQNINGEEMELTNIRSDGEDSGNIESDIESSSDKEDKVESIEEKMSGFPNFGKTKDGESFLTLNGNIEHSEAKERS